MYKNIIFDFDGTINDSRDYTLQTFLNLSKNKVGEKFDSIRDKSPKEIIDEFRDISFADIKKRFKLNIISFFSIVNLVQEEEYKFITTSSKEEVLTKLPFYEGMLELIERLNKEGVNIYLLSSNKEKVLRALLKHTKTFSMFKRIVGGTKLFGKASKIRSLMRKERLKASDTVYIGDEVRDITASQKVGIDIASVTWGYASMKQLVKYNPTFICESVGELERVLTTDN